MREHRQGHIHMGFRLDRRLFLVLVVVVVSLLLSLFIGRHLEIKRFRRELVELHQAKDAASAEQEALRERLASADDPTAVESLAREKLGLVMPGEEKVIFVEEGAP